MDLLMLAANSQASEGLPEDVWLVRPRAGRSGRFVMDSLRLAIDHRLQPTEAHSVADPAFWGPGLDSTVLHEA